VSLKTVLLKTVDAWNYREERCCEIGFDDDEDETEDGVVDCI
jgi:hypothetical protein